MNTDNDKALVEDIRQRLAQHADAVDEFTAARLAAARARALAQPSPSRARHWLALTGMGVAAAVLLAVLVVHQAPRPDGDWELLMSADDMDLVEELDFYAWLEATQSSS